ncbi:hypothetical protein HDK77DRAFT_55345 [Phyllosticta capitalensis]
MPPSQACCESCSFWSHSLVSSCAPFLPPIGWLLVRELPGVVVYPAFCTDAVQRESWFCGFSCGSRWWLVRARPPHEAIRRQETKLSSEYGGCTTNDNVPADELLLPSLMTEANQHRQIRRVKHPCLDDVRMWSHVAGGDFWEHCRRSERQHRGSVIVSDAECLMFCSGGARSSGYRDSKVSPSQCALSSRCTVAAVASETQMEKLDQLFENHLSRNQWPIPKEGRE